jgi:hypothetical protein
VRQEHDVAGKAKGDLRAVAGAPDPHSGYEGRLPRSGALPR